MSLSEKLDFLRASLLGRGHQYTALETPDTTDTRRQHRRQQRQKRRAQLQYVEPELNAGGRKRRLVKVSAGGVVLLIVLSLLFGYGGSLEDTDECEALGNCTVSQQSWGQYSPYFPAPSRINASVPQDCTVTFAQVLSRHGSRDPTARKSELYMALVERIQSSVTNYSPGYEFIRDYTYTLGADQLTSLGEEEMVESGRTFYGRYKDLADGHEPFLRAAGSERVVASAKKFMNGFYESKGDSGEEQMGKIVIVPEQDGFNNSLNHGGCPRFESGPTSEVGQSKKDAWRDVWVPPIQNRLNEKLPGANISLDETIFMMDLCPFNTVASPNATQSQFCALFSDKEWRQYDYYETLDKWYGHGPGNPMGPTQGVGFVNELVARLTGRPVDDGTSTNSTLDAGNSTFPLGRALYADFSHDNLMTSVYGAMGLYDGAEELPVRYSVPAWKRKGYSAAWTVPFGARMYVEKMRCSSGGRGSDSRELDAGVGDEYVRVLVNERVMRMRSCRADYRGLCTLDAFMESLAFARGGGRWDECFAS